MTCAIFKINTFIIIYYWLPKFLSKEISDKVISVISKNCYEMFAYLQIVIKWEDQVEL